MKALRVKMFKFIVTKNVRKFCKDKHKNFDRFKKREKSLEDSVVYF